MMRKIAVALLLVSLAVPAASASPRGDDTDPIRAIGTRIERVIRHIFHAVHVLDDFWPGPPKP